MIRGYDELKGLTFDALDASDFKIEQFTGLKDVNGKEIYEGDILEYYYETHGQTFYDPDTLGAIGGEPGIETDVIGKVAIWPSTGVVLTRIKAEYPEDFDSSNFDVPKMLHVNKRFTIIGNVHDNPELLEADK
ncbi:prophage Lp1 protein 30 [Lactiplantibacillus plantarum]|nr:prophage Lp1 protein 30 [Lactiplantibacillus plantarum]